MFDKFGEFDSAEELNRAAAAQKAEGDEEALLAIAKENGIDQEDAEDFMDDVTEELVTPLMAAAGKLKVEAENLKLEELLLDWKDQVLQMCTEDPQMAIAVRRKGKSLAQCLSALLKFSFENKIRVNDRIVDITKINHNGKMEQMRKPIYMGIPGRQQVKRMVKEYYLGRGGK